MDTCYSSLFCKRTHRHVGNPLSFQVSPRAKRDQTKSPARSANSSRKAISFQDAPEPEGRRRVNYRTPPQAPSGRGARPRSGRFFRKIEKIEKSRKIMILENFQIFEKVSHFLDFLNDFFMD